MNTQSSAVFKQCRSGRILTLTAAAPHLAESREPDSAGIFTVLAQRLCYLLDALRVRSEAQEQNSGHNVMASCKAVAFTYQGASSLACTCSRSTGRRASSYGHNQSRQWSLECYTRPIYQCCVHGDAYEASLRIASI